MKYLLLGMIAGAAIVYLFAKQKKDSDSSTKQKSDSEQQKPLQEANGDDSFEKLRKAINALVEQLSIVQVLTYEDAMKYFIAHKGDNAKIAQGAMLKEKSEKHILFTQVFLDAENNIACDDKGNPVGRKLKVVALDNELLNVFKNQDLVIVK